MNLSNIKFMSYIEIYNEVTTSYKEKYGIDKMNDLLDEIMNSDKISELIQQKTYKGVSPNVKDFIYCLNGIPFFILKKDITLATGAIIALERWNLEINHHSHTTGKLLLDNDELKMLAVFILQDSDNTKFSLHPLSALAILILSSIPVYLISSLLSLTFSIDNWNLFSKILFWGYWIVFGYMTILDYFIYPHFFARSVRCHYKGVYWEKFFKEKLLNNTN
ncbi:MAG: hypothetical protein CL823_00545 [Crocinitomicaceae bacterium]|nr:hypothetical protein [Crocinitomicaceae bacterium]|tara:strand:- start:1915 stop:2574 length:660 start_codon:yes stop_codon:yes gene_type:complete